MKKFMLLMAVLALLLCGCGNGDTPQTTEGIQIIQPQGPGEAVTPEDGDIVIEITP